ncbi:uncharacterized protein LOC127813437 [Diospyros lotus]|uniref:uncharacterized protein LOC127813437 n=1 Tax=Diospyros lotus TaxID=55363 RepID=UPI002255C876|nr:uncharacterized protein LOC127813437 [Diospyros lotus]
MCVGLQQNVNGRLNIKEFYLRLSVSDARKPTFPDSLTLHYLPRINGSALDIGFSRLRPDSPGFVTLHRVLSAERAPRVAIFGSRERVRASEGVGFEVYVGDEKLLKGIFRRGEEEQEWRIECKCVLEREMVGLVVREAEVCVAAEEGQAAAMSARVEMAVGRQRWRRRYCGLEDIPEQREVECESDEWGGCSCSGDEVEKEVAHGDCVEMEGVGWAVDVGIWVMCLGIGFLVSRASSGSLRRMRKSK